MIDDERETVSSDVKDDITSTQITVSADVNGDITGQADADRPRGSFVLMTEDAFGEYAYSTNWGVG